MSRLAIFMSFSGQGGVERMVLNLLEGFTARGVEVDLLAVRSGPDSLDKLPQGVRLIDLKAGHTSTALPALVRYLRRERPRAMLAAKDRAIRTAVIARRLAGVDTRLVGRLGTNLSASLEGRSGLQRASRYLPMRWLYPSVDSIVAVSAGVAEDIRAITGLPEDKVTVIRNPVITPRLATLAEKSVDHPWLQPGQPPVILGAGRLTRQKDFPSLLRAFAEVRRQRDCRLIILGDGRGRDALLALAEELGVADDLDLPGFQPNPYAYMRRAALFVLSSAWEGSPNVLTEALALGVPSVSTDCPSGPREILEGGRYGPLVPVGDVAALARGMETALREPLPADTLREAASEYDQTLSAARYLETLGLTPSD